MTESNLHAQMNEEARQAREENARRQIQFDYFDDVQWQLVASEPKKAIAAGLRLLYRLVLAVEDAVDKLDERL